MVVRVTREVLPLIRSPDPDTEIFAFGDVHGRSDLLRVLMEDAASTPKLAPRRVAVFLGDLIDRGPDSLGAIELAASAASRIGADECIGLMGNHETLMRMALETETDPMVALDAFSTWIRNGGGEVLAEFVEPSPVPRYPDELLAAARAAAPPGIGAWLSGLRSHWRNGGLLFVHAGLHPQIPVDSVLEAPWNTPLELLDEDAHWAWVRWPFLGHEPGADGHHGYFVVHGHTPNDGARSTRHADQIGAYRLNLDGGSGMTGVCKMGYFRGGWVEVVSAKGPTNRELAG